MWLACGRLDAGNTNSLLQAQRHGRILDGEHGPCKSQVTCNGCGAGIVNAAAAAVAAAKYFRYESGAQ